MKWVVYYHPFLFYNRTMNVYEKRKHNLNITKIKGFAKWCMRELEIHGYEKDTAIIISNHDCEAGAYDDRFETLDKVTYKDIDERLIIILGRSLIKPLLKFYIAHELTHIKQFVHKKLLVSNSGYTIQWNGKLYSKLGAGTTKYNSQPWEIEANKTALKLVFLYIKEKIVERFRKIFKLN